MIGNYIRIPENDLNRLLANPESIMDFLYPEDESLPLPDRRLDIDKSWHIIHFLLTGETWEGKEPLRNVVLGGTLIGEVDVGYGPARYLTPPEVREISKALSSISESSLWARFDRQAVLDHEIYPDGWEGNETERGYMQGYFGQLKVFFEEAAKQNESVILYLN